MGHIHKEIDFTVCAYIVHKKEVLLVDHKALRRWLPVGGHIELNQDPEEALYNEIEEESGLVRAELEIFGRKPDLVSEGTKFLTAPTFLDIHRISSTHRHVGMVYFVKALNNLVILSDEHNRIKWFKENELLSPEYSVSPAVVFYGKAALDTLGWG